MDGSEGKGSKNMATSDYFRGVSIHLIRTKKGSEGGLNLKLKYMTGHLFGGLTEK
jgi:hypothetical protein